MSKTFREVVKDIQENEVWENEIAVISCDHYGKIVIKNKSDFDALLFFAGDRSFKLATVKADWDKAMAAYEMGMKIESLVSGITYKLGEGTAVFNLEELKGGWLIYEQTDN